MQRLRQFRILDPVVINRVIVKGTQKAKLFATKERPQLFILSVTLKLVHRGMAFSNDAKLWAESTLFVTVRVKVIIAEYFLDWEKSHPSGGVSK
jgi:hypothetical protein